MTNVPEVELIEDGADPATLQSYQLQVVLASAQIEVKRLTSKTWLLKIEEPSGTQTEIRFESDSPVSASIIGD